MSRRRWSGRHRIMSNSDALTGAFDNSGRKERTWRHDLADLTKTYGAEGARQRLGVSATTWRRWNKGTQSPSAANMGKVRSEWDTPAVRRRTIAPRRASKATTNGANVRVGGQIGPYASGGRDTSAEPRDRDINFDLDGEQMRELYDAYAEDGPDAAHELLQHFAVVEYFFTGWQGEGDFENDPDAQAYIDDLTELEFDIFDEPPDPSEYDLFDE